MWRRGRVGGNEREFGVVREGVQERCNRDGEEKR